MECSEDAPDHTQTENAEGKAAQPSSTLVAVVLLPQTQPNLHKLELERLTHCLSVRWERPGYRATPRVELLSALLCSRSSGVFITELTVLGLK